MANPMRAGSCVCGVPVSAHFDAQNRKLACEQVYELRPVDLGRLLRLMAEHRSAAHQAALESVRQLPSGGWRGRVGGRLRGDYVTGTKASVVEAIDQHYRSTGLRYRQRRRPCWK